MSAETVSRGEFRWVIGGALTLVVLSVGVAFSQGVATRVLQVQMDTQVSLTTEMSQTLTEIRDILLASGTIPPRVNR